MGDYTINGKVLILPITGNGRSNLTMDNVKIIIKLGPLAVTERKNQMYVQVDKIKISFSTTRFVAYLTVENFNILFNFYFKQTSHWPYKSV